MVHREAAVRPHLALTGDLLPPQMVELLISGLSADTSAEIRARAAEVIVFFADARATPVLRNLLRDHQWFVRLRALRALTRVRQAAAPLQLDIRDCLRDSHWRVREAAIQALISLGQEGKNQLYEYFLTSPDHASHQQIVEAIERTGLMSALVREYSEGAKGVAALMVEHLASNLAPLGFPGVLRALNPDVRQRFLDRFIPFAQSKGMTLPEQPLPKVERTNTLQPVLDFPPFLAA